MALSSFICASGVFCFSCATPERRAALSRRSSVVHVWYLLTARGTSDWRHAMAATCLAAYACATSSFDFQDWREQASCFVRAIEARASDANGDGGTPPTGVDEGVLHAPSRKGGKRRGGPRRYTGRGKGKGSLALFRTRTRFRRPRVETVAEVIFHSFGLGPPEVGHGDPFVEEAAVEEPQEQVRLPFATGGSRFPATWHGVLVRRRRFHPPNTSRNASAKPSSLNSSPSTSQQSWARRGTEVNPGMEQGGLREGTRVHERLTVRARRGRRGPRRPRELRSLSGPWGNERKGTVRLGVRFDMQQPSFARGLEALRDTLRDRESRKGMQETWTKDGEEEKPSESPREGPKDPNEQVEPDESKSKEEELPKGLEAWKEYKRRNAEKQSQEEEWDEMLETIPTSP
eukprot:scaffold2044_cov305-Pavlova_lutheri.AAC.5